MAGNIVIVTDIFGSTEELSALCGNLKEQGVGVTCISPYTRPEVFSSEEQAYAAFTACGGMDSYIEKVRRLLLVSGQTSNVIGFSAGASVLWALSQQIEFDRALLFYPGQIRHYLDVSPINKPVIVFPKRERHFDLQQIITKLRGASSAQILQIEAEHGFVNASSQGYDKLLSSAVFQFLAHWPKMPHDTVLKRVTSALTLDPNNNKNENDG